MRAGRPPGQPNRGARHGLPVIAERSGRLLDQVLTQNDLRPADTLSE